jgi:hypothetical protein
LIALRQNGLVRPLDAQQEVWEISHDFVARLLARIIATWRATVWEQMLRWAPPIAFAIWLVVVLIPWVTPRWYQRIPIDKLNERTPDGEFPIHHTLNEPFPTDAVAYFKQNGVDLDATDGDDRTTLEYAVTRDSCELVEALTNNGAQLDPIYLLVAAQAGSNKVIPFLLDKVRDPNFADTNSQTALHRAAEAGRVQAIEFSCRRAQTRMPLILPSEPP